MELNWRSKLRHWSSVFVPTLVNTTDPKYLPLSIRFKFPCCLTRNITSHSTKNAACHSLLGWKMILPILTNSLINFSFRRLGEWTREPHPWCYAEINPESSSNNTALWSGSLQSRHREQHTVVANDADRIAVDPSEDCGYKREARDHVSHRILSLSRALHGTGSTVFTRPTWTEHRLSLRTYKLMMIMNFIIQ